MKKFFFTLIFGLLSATGMQAQLSSNPDKFLGNITTRGNVDYGNEKFYQLWNQITPENETKWDATEGSARGSFNFSGADRSANYAKQHKFPFKYHTLIWGAQYPSWVNNLSTAEQYKALVEYFDGVKKHYPNLEIIDVVNEAIQGHQPAPYRAALGGEGRTGYDWIIKAFHLAHERWPNAILVYNDYNSFTWQKSQFIDLVRALRDAGAPIDAYGHQSHDLTDISLSNFKSAMNEINTALQMPMYSTEFDIGTSDDKKQETQYKNLIPVLWEADYCAGITLWGYIYGATWTTDGNSGIIRNGSDRPAMTWLREYMKSEKAKTAKSPFPGFKKEFSVYVRPASMKVAKGDKLPVWVDATAATKTIEKVELYMGSTLVGTLTEAPYIFEISSTSTGSKTLKAVVTATDGTTWERLSRVVVDGSATARTTYKETPAELPGTIVANEYDKGIAGVSYNNAVRTGATRTGGWMEYTVDVKEAGLYSVDVEVSSTQNGGMFHLVDNYFGNMTFLTDFVTVPNTDGSYRNFHLRFSAPLEAGRRTLCLCIDQGGFNLRKMTFSRLETNSSVRTSVKVSPTTVNVGDTATITATASRLNSGSIAYVRIFANDMLVDTLFEAPYVAKFVPKTKGNYVITAIATDTDGIETSAPAKATLKVNGQRTPYAVVNLPGTLQCENFDQGGEGLSFHDSDDRDEGDAHYRTDNEGVDIVKGNGGSAIGYTAANEWLEYTVNVKEAGEYNCEAYVSSGTTGAAFTVSLRDNNQTRQLCRISIPQTGDGSWDTYATVKTKLSQALPEGQHILRITITGPTGNLDKLVFTRDTSGEEEQPSTADPNFYVYLCFGQSNMEGNATPEAVDQTVDPRFQTLACVDFSNPKRTMGQWYTATPPIVRQGTGLGMADYFGRTMVKNLPENVKVGVVDVAIGGTAIEGFFSEQVQNYLIDQADWLKNYFAAYDNDPYQRLVDMARIAQKSGVIKGILLHQGESNNMQSDWPQKVKTIYDRLISDLNLNPKETPMFVGETVRSELGGSCGGHNSVIAKVPNVISNSYVISSADCPQKGDGLHFTAQGYRIMGARYAIQALKLMGIEIVDPLSPLSDLDIEKDFTSLSSIGTTPFAIINAEDGKAFFCSTGQDLGYDVYDKAFDDSNAGYYFLLEKVSGVSRYMLRLVQPDGTPYSVGENPGYLNSSAVEGSGCFINGLNGQDGYEIANGALWVIKHVSERGFMVKNVGTGKYLHDATPAKYDNSVYFNFCKLGTSDGIDLPFLNTQLATPNTSVYSLQGVKVGTREQWESLPRGIYIVNGKLVTKR